MRIVGTGESAGAFSDDQQWEKKTRQTLKDYAMTHRSRLCFCKQDFSHNLSSQSQAELMPRALPFCYLHHFHSRSARLPDWRGKTGKESREMKQEKHVICESGKEEYVGTNTCWRCGYWALLWYSMCGGGANATTMMELMVRSLHRAGNCCESCMSRSSSSLHSAQLDWQVTGRPTSWTEYTLFSSVPFVICFND